jgi:small subunit ribosomal protein S16
LAVKIRLKKMGSKKRPFYRVVAADVRSPRDGRFIETLGYYNPMVDPPEIKLDHDKVYKWLDEGAEPTVNARNVLKLEGLIERWQLLKKGVTIAELDAKIEERRAKQPKPTATETKKLSKKAAAKAKEEAEKAEVAEQEKEEKPVAETAEKPAAEKPAAESAEEPAPEQPAADEGAPEGGEEKSDS